MKKFEYQISAHPAETFKQVAYFCSEDGKCNLEEIPGDQIQRLSEILNQRGLEGWDLVQVSFGQGGLLAFWKRELAA